ncbi:MAG: tetratricopeptide repeat protein, partial [Blastocatellia bacterium]
IDRAINLLCDVFERNPGDVELLTILGRTYLQASMMDDAERTFLSLVELDRNRYHYLLEVGRRFLQMGDLDRAAEQIDGCLDVLIGKREEDKAIDFLRKILDRDMNHVGGLKRLVQIFLRIREDHNVIATLNSLVEAAMRKGDDESAIEALKELARMEPDEPMHLQRLYTLGVKDIVESGAPDVVRATGPLDYGAAAFDDTFVVRQVSEAEILAGHGQVTHAIDILTGILQHAPENVQVHLKLKDIYLRAGQMDKAAQECLELSRIHERRGEAARASDYLAEARQLNPLLDTSAQEMAAQTNDWMSEASSSFDHTPAAAPTNGNGNGNGASHANGFDLPESPAEMDWSRYQTGMLSDLGGFVTVPGQGAQTNGLNATAHAQDGTVAALAESQGFRYTDTLVGDADRQAGERHSDLLFSATDKLPSDTMSSVLRDELEGIDFYIAQGYLEIAQDALERLQKENGAHPEILARFAQLGIGAAEAPQAGAPAAVVEAPASPAREAEVAAVEKYLTPVANEQEADTHSFAFAPAANTEAEDAGEPAEIDLSMFVADGLPMPEAAPPPAVPAATNEPAEAAKPKATERPPSYTGSLVGHNLDDVALNTFAPPEEEKHEPFMIHKETGPLQADLIVKFNSSDLLHNNMFDQEQRSSMESGASGGTQDLLDSLVSNIDASFDHIQHGGEAEQGEDDGPLALASGPLEMFGESPLTATTDSDGAESGFDLPEMNEPLSFDPPFLPAADEGEAFENTTSWSGDLLAETRPRSDLDDILEELREESGPLSPSGDFETHFSLGLAYKDMDLLDDAIGEFQSAFRMAGSEDVNGDYIQCCNMLGVCFKRKQLPKVAIMWFERGLKIPHRLEDEYQALRYEIAMCYEELGELDKALDAFMEVYGSDVNYRETAAKIRQLQAAKNQ